jgi:hypothetical protein
MYKLRLIQVSVCDVQDQILKDEQFELSVGLNRCAYRKCQCKQKGGRSLAPALQCSNYFANQSVIGSLIKANGATAGQRYFNNRIASLNPRSN